MKIEIQTNPNSENSYIDSIKSLFPEIFNDHFKLISTKKEGGILNLYFKEKNLFTKGFETENLKLVGFFPHITIQEIQIRGQLIYLNIKRRKWVNVYTNVEGFIDWNSYEMKGKSIENFETLFTEINKQKSFSY